MTKPEKQKENVVTCFHENDGTQIYYKDGGTGQPVVFSDGWPLSAGADRFFLVTGTLVRHIRARLILHGDDDQIVPIADSALLSSSW